MEQLKQPNNYKKMALHYLWLRLKFMLADEVEGAAPVQHLVV